MAMKLVIKGVHVVPMGMSNAFLIEGDDGLTLIDAGFPGKEEVVFGAIRELGRSPDQIKHLIFTHGHPDHIGSAATCRTTIEHAVFSVRFFVRILLVKPPAMFKRSRRYFLLDALRGQGQPPAANP
jgi:glyoxylase-like metal-dependent hydrolase (beta-lactamase superfamily II)